MAEQTMRERVARVCCKSYGDEYDEQPKDLAALRAERSRQRGGKPFTVDGVEHDADTVFAYDPGLPTQADWLEMADAVLAEIETPDAAMIDKALAVTASWLGIKGSQLTVNREKMRVRFAGAIRAAREGR